MDIKNLSIVRQSFANAVFTHKIHEVAADLQGKKAKTVKILNITFVGVVLILLAFQVAFPSSIFLSVIASGVTIGEVVFLVVQLTFNYEQGVTSHKNTALKYLGLRDEYRLLITDIMNESIDAETISARRDVLQRQYHLISELSPQTSPEEYTETQKRLNTKGAKPGEEFTWSDIEINRFLPEKLRL